MRPRSGSYWWKNANIESRPVAQCKPLQRSSKELKNGRYVPDVNGRTYNTPDGKPPAFYGGPLTSTQNGQTQQEYWNNGRFVPNK